MLIKTPTHILTHKPNQLYSSAIHQAQRLPACNLFLRRKTTVDGLDNDSGNLVWIRIAGRSPVLKVSLALSRAGSWNSHTRPTVRHTPGEFVDATRFVLAGQTVSIALAIHFDVLDLAGFEFLHGRFDVLHAALLAHIFRRDVGVQPGAVPVSWDGLRSEGDHCAKLFGDAVEEES
jgi:hypothetical protein